LRLGAHSFVGAVGAVGGSAVEVVVRVAGAEAGVTWAFCFPFALAVVVVVPYFCLVLPLFTLARRAVAVLLQASAAS
jgi:hypothetical protein